MPTPLARHPRFIRIEFAPSSGCLGSIVSVVTDFCRNEVDDPDIGFAFRLAAYELTENLIKYASGVRVSIKIEVERTPEGPELVLTTENEASPERLADVDARLRALEQAPDPVAHFDSLVQQSLSSPDESRLGLGRLRAEGDLRICHELRNGSIRIQARRSVHQKEKGCET